MLIIDSDSLPKAIAAKLRRALSAHGVKCSLVQSLNLSAAMLVEFADWADLKKKLGASLVIKDDSELDAPALEARRLVQVQALVAAGCSPSLAAEVLEKVQPTGKRASLGPEAFEAQDDFATAGLRAPAWRNLKEKQPTLAEIYDAADGMLIRNDPEQLAGIEIPDFRDPVTGEFSFDALRDYYQQKGWDFVETEDGPMLNVNNLRADEKWVRHCRNFDRRLLEAGSASLWEARDVRAVRQGPDGKWQAAPGRMVAEVVLMNGSEREMAVSELFTAGVIDGLKMGLFEAVPTPKGMAVVETDTRRPMYLLKRSEAQRVSEAGAAGTQARASMVELEAKIRGMVVDRQWAQAAALSVAAWKMADPVAKMILEACIDDLVQQAPTAEKVRIGFNLLRDFGGPPELSWPEKAEEVLLQAAADLEAGRPDDDQSTDRIRVNATLGHFYTGRFGGYEDKAQAIARFESAAMAGHAVSAVNAASLLLTEESPDYGRAKAVLRVGSSCDAPGQAECKGALGGLLVKEAASTGDKAGLEEAVQLLVEAAKLGNESARSMIVGMLRN